MELFRNWTPTGSINDSIPVQGILPFRSGYQKIILATRKNNILSFTVMLYFHLMFHY